MCLKTSFESFLWRLSLYISGIWLPDFLAFRNNLFNERKLEYKLSHGLFAKSSPWEDTLRRFIERFIVVYILSSRMSHFRTTFFECELFHN
jgi:hypothetical protein